MHFTPSTLADARARLADPASVGCHPALLADAWATLKEARGQAVRLDRLIPAHLIDPAPPVAGLASRARAAVMPVEEARARAIMALRRILRARAETGAPLAVPLAIRPPPTRRPGSEPPEAA